MARKTYIPTSADRTQKVATHLTKYRSQVLAAAATYQPTQVSAVAAAIDNVIAAAGVLESLHLAYDPNAHKV